MKRLIALGAMCTGVVMAGLPAAAAAPPVPAGQVASGLTYTANTVVVPRNVVSANLIGIGPGGTFKFRHAAGPLAKLRVGSVMLLEGSAAGTVTALNTRSGQLIVVTRDAPLAAIVSSGSISFSGTPDVGQAFVAPIDQAGSTTAAAPVRRASLVSPAFPYVAGPLVLAASGPALSLQGGTGGPFGYSVTAEPTGPSSLHLSGTICYGHGDICANGPASGISLEASFDGTVDLSKISGEVDLAHSTIDKLRAAFEGIRSNFKVAYTFSRGEGGTGALTFPAFHIPLGIDIPIPGTIPLFARIQLGLLLQVLSKPAKNTVSHGAIDAQLAGSANIADGGGTPSASGAGASGSGSVSAGTAGLGISPGILGLVVATQVKVGIAVGVTVANLLAYTDLVGSIGQEQASAFTGGFCSSYIGILTWGAGIEAQLGGGALGIAAGKKWELKSWDFHFTEPGCKEISA
ncbi:MAG TPA: hypothetical protein VME46_18640 [Acidimicrobiales bacterium]|nr:hypothetical protein [Acidimicrobiales bacterium]